MTKKKVHLAMKKNTENLCGFFEDNKSSPGTDGSASCSVTVLLQSGVLLEIIKSVNVVASVNTFTF